MARLPIHAFSGSISHPVHVARAEDTLRDSFNNLVKFRLGNAVNTSVSAEAGEMFEYSTPIVAIVNSQNHIIGHLCAENISHASNSLEQALNTQEETTKASLYTPTLPTTEAIPGMTSTAGPTTATEVTSSDPGAVLTKMLRPLEMQTGEYVEFYAPESLQFWIVPDSISVIELFRIFVQNHLHHVWVASADAAPKPRRAGEAGPIELVHVRGIITLTDALRCLARDNLWLKASHIPKDFARDIAGHQGRRRQSVPHVSSGPTSPM